MQSRVVHGQDARSTHKSSIEVSAWERYGGGEFWRFLLLVVERCTLGFWLSAIVLPRTASLS